MGGLLSGEESSEKTGWDGTEWDRKNWGYEVEMEITTATNVVGKECKKTYRDETTASRRILRGRVESSQSRAL